MRVVRHLEGCCNTEAKVYRHPCRQPVSNPAAPVASTSSQAQQAQARPRVQLPSLQQVLLLTRFCNTIRLCTANSDCNKLSTSSCLPGASRSAITVRPQLVSGLYLCVRLFPSAHCHQQYQLGHHKQTRCQSTKSGFIFSSGLRRICSAKQHRPTAFCTFDQSAASPNLTSALEASIDSISVILCYNFTIGALCLLFAPMCPSVHV